MKYKFLLIFLFFQFELISAQTFDTTYGVAKVVLVETDPWLIVIGSDVPTFTLYENGQIIYKKVVDHKTKYYEVQLTEGKAQDFVKSLCITDSILKQPDYIEATSLTDQPTNILIMNIDTESRKIVYGRLREPGSEAREKVSPYFLSVFDKIIEYESSEAEEWLPDKIEIMFTSYDYSPEEPLKWPVNWPDLNTASTVKRNDNLFSVYLDKKYFREFLALAKSLKEKQAIELNSKRVSVSYRFPFPNMN
jgi:hypothetical protein